MFNSSLCLTEYSSATCYRNLHAFTADESTMHSVVLIAASLWLSSVGTANRHMSAVSTADALQSGNIYTRQQQNNPEGAVYTEAQACVHCEHCEQTEHYTELLKLL